MTKIEQLLMRNLDGYYLDHVKETCTIIANQSDYGTSWEDIYNTMTTAEKLDMFLDYIKEILK